MHFSISKQWGAIDFKVWLSLIVLACISLGLFGYRMAHLEKCPVFKITYGNSLAHQHESSNIFFTNETITFDAGVQAAGNALAWDFGDKTVSKTGTQISHSYAKEGNYLVSLTINGRCKESVNIKIVQNQESHLNNIIPAVNPIVSNDIFKIGDKADFNTSAASGNYVWGIEELPALGKVTTRSASFIFPKAGNYTVSLLLDDGATYKKMVQVVDPIAGAPTSVTPLPPVTPMDVPPAPTPVEPMPLPQKKEEQPVVKEEATPAAPEKPSKTYDQLPTPAIQEMLVGVTEGKKTLKDFDNILCNGAGTKVMANDQATTFAALVNELHEKKGLPLMKKKRKIQSVTVVRDDKNGNCVSLLYVDYK